jgi:hypothetical protein
LRLNGQRLGRQHRDLFYFAAAVARNYGRNLSSRI